MYNDFRVIEIVSDLRNKAIEICFSYDIDPDSINDKTISLVNRATKAPVDYTFELKPQAVHLTLMQWPEPNTDYIIKISGLVNIVGDILKEGGARRKLVFKSSLCSCVEITSPAHEESVDKVLIKWREIQPNPNLELVNKYRIEVATDANFHYIEKSLLIEDKQEALVTGLEEKQYYVRGRVENQDEYGFWSMSNGFIVTSCGCAVDTDCPAQDDDSEDNDGSEDFPVFEDDLTILTPPPNGIHLDSFLIEFDDILSDDIIDRIIVIRRDY